MALCKKCGNSFKKKGKYYKTCDACKSLVIEKRVRESKRIIKNRLIFELTKGV